MLFAFGVLLGIVLGVFIGCLAILAGRREREIGHFFAAQDLAARRKNHDPFTLPLC